MKATSNMVSPHRHNARAPEPPAPLDGAAGPHERAMWWSAELRESWRRMWKPEALRVEPHDVISVLNDAEIDFVLMGAHAMAGWFERPRATQDVDILVAKRHHLKAVKALKEAYPELTVNDTPMVTRFTDPASKQVVIDVMKPMHDIHQTVFRHTVAVGTTHRIPDLEMALAAKFAAMVSPYREIRRKRQDAVDFGEIAIPHQAKIDREKLRRLGELVYPRGGEEICQFLNDMIEGKPIRL